MNPLGNGNKTQNIDNPLNGLMNFINGGGSPQQIMHMMQQNPNFNAMMQQIQSTGKSPKELVMQVAKERGIDPSQIQQFVNKMGRR